MVRLNALLSRVPVVMFRKGGKPCGSPSQSPGTKSGSCLMMGAMGTPVAPAQPAAAMSTGATPNKDLPARYRRTPLSQEEIDNVNGGGINDPIKSKSSKDPQMLGVIKIPKGILVKSGNKKQEVVSLNLVLQKGSQKK